MAAKTQLGFFSSRSRIRVMNRAMACRGESVMVCSLTLSRKSNRSPWGAANVTAHLVPPMSIPTIIFMFPP